MRVTNTTTQRLTVILKGEAKDGHAPTDSLDPGETKDVTVDPENVSFKGLLFAGALVDVGGAKKAPAKE